MRGAGCVYNDIVDADLDRQVARTASRPVASGRVSPKAAWAWLFALCGVGLVVLLQLRWQAQLVALASLALVAAYPFMKRITWWPQAWLGLVFTWGALVGWTALRSDRLDVLAALYAGSIFWCIGYDTIYALQDREDDALVGIRSSALRLGANVQAGVIAFYGLALTGWGLAFWLLRADWLALIALAARGAAPDVASLHARSGRPRQPTRPLPLEPLHRAAGGGRLPRRWERLISEPGARPSTSSG
jgi:4-hydroxybenzoate polyprenyltransferase